MSVAMPNVKNFVQRGAGAAGALPRRGWRRIWGVGARRWTRNAPRRRFSAHEGQNTVLHGGANMLMVGAKMLSVSMV